MAILVLLALVVWKLRSDAVPPPPPLWTEADIPSAPPRAENGFDDLRAVSLVGGDGEPNTTTISVHPSAEVRDALLKLRLLVADARVPKDAPLLDLYALAKGDEQTLGRHDAQFCRKAFGRPRMAFSCTLDDAFRIRACPSRAYDNCHDWMVVTTLLHFVNRDDGVSLDPKGVASLASLLRRDGDMLTTSIGKVQPIALKKTQDTLALVAWALNYARASNTAPPDGMRAALGPVLKELPLTNRANQLATLPGYLQRRHLVATSNGGGSSAVLRWSYNRSQTHQILNQAYEARDRHGQAQYPKGMATSPGWMGANYAGKLLLQMHKKSKVDLEGVTAAVKRNDDLRRKNLDLLSSATPSRDVPRPSP